MKEDKRWEARHVDRPRTDRPWQGLGCLGTRHGQARVLTNQASPGPLTTIYWALLIFQTFGTFLTPSNNYIMGLFLSF